MMQPAAATGMAPPPSAMNAPQQTHYLTPPQSQQWGPPPPPAPQQWNQQPSQVPPPMWNQQPSQVPPPVPVPPPQPMPVAAPPQMTSQPYQTQVTVPPLQQSAEEARTLWIGDLQYWMDETYIQGCFASTGEVISVKLIRNKQTGHPEGYGFVEFATHATADRVLQSYNGQTMPNVEQRYKLNWASLGSGEKQRDAGPDYSIFVGDLSADVTDYMLQETFRAHYPSVKGAKVVIDRITGRSKGYGFVKFGDGNEQARAMTEMNGMFCSTRPMRIGPATSKKTVVTHQVDPAKASYQSGVAIQSESDPNNTTIFVGGLDASVTDDQLRQVFGQYGELVYVKIPIGKQCGFVQFANRASAEEALLALNGTMLGGRNIRLSWGRSPTSKQVQQQQDANQWGGGNYYGYGQGYDAYGYAQPTPDPNMYAYGAYQGYGGYQQQQQQ